MNTPATKVKNPGRRIFYSNIPYYLLEDIEIFVYQNGWVIRDDVAVNQVVKAQPFNLIPDICNLNSIVVGLLGVIFLPGFSELEKKYRG